MRVVVTGSRKWGDVVALRQALNDVQRKSGGMGEKMMLAHGAARGADRLAGIEAEALGWRVREFPVDETIDGPWPGAGCERNARMLYDFAPDVVLAFPTAESRGTWDCIHKASDRGILVVIVPPRKETT